MKRVLIGVSITLGLAFIAIVLFLALTDFSRYRTSVEQSVSEATGRDFRIAGEFRPDFFPLSFVAEDVTLANAEWGSDAPFLSVGHLSIRAELWSIFSGPFTINEFRLHDVSVLLETNEAGDGNWQMEPREPDVVVDVGEPDDLDAEPIVIELAEIHDISLTIRSPGQDDRQFSIAAIDIVEQDNGYAEARGSGSIDGESLTLSASIGPRANYVGGAPIDYSLEAYLGAMALTASGRTADRQNNAPPVFEATFTSDDIADVLTLLGQETEVSMPLRVSANLDTETDAQLLRIVANAGDISLNASADLVDEQLIVDASLGPLAAVGELLEIDGLPDQSLAANGTLTYVPDGLALTDMSVQVEPLEVIVNGLISSESGVDTALKVDFLTDDLSELDTALPGIPLQATLMTKLAPQRITISEFELSFADSDLSGTLEVLTGNTPAASGEFHSNLLDLTPFLPAEPEASEQAAEAAPAADDQPPAEFVFADEPLPFDMLNAGTIDVSLNIDRYVRGPVQLQNVETAVALTDGTLELGAGFKVPAGGSANTTVTLVSRDSSADLALNLDVSDLRLSLSDDNERADVDIPHTSIAADITASGATPRALASSTGGSLLFTQGPGKVDNTAMGFFAADIISELFGALNPFAENEPYSNWECTVVALKFTDGIGEIEPMLAQSEKVTIVGGGEIDLTEETLDIRFNTKPRKGVGVSADMFVTPFIRLGGTLAAPRIALDKSGILLTGGAAFLTGGISFLVQGAADRATGATDRCAAALALAKGEEVQVEE